MTIMNNPNGMDQVYLDGEPFTEALKKSADEIAQSPLILLEKLCFVGIRRRGVPLAKRLAAEVSANTGLDFPQGALDITLYRDDLSQIAPNPVVNVTDIPFDITGKTLLLVDDVLFTGRTVRAALDALIDLGRPAAIRLWAMVDRGLREFPIQADFRAFQIETTRDQIVEVHVNEIDGDDSIHLLMPNGART
jgi:pyrimidine operon attenuation protein/uracil phosphoribosyltransferase